MRAGITQRSIDAVCLSHLHQDHCCDLAVLLADRAFGRLVPPAVYGPKGVEAFVLAGASYVKTMAHAENALPAFCEVADGDQRDVCGFAVRWAVTPHAPDLVALATRYEADGRSVVYSGDTRAAPEVMVPLAQDADVLMHECFSNERMQRVMPTVAPEIAQRLGHFRDVHSEVRDVAAIARDAGVRRLVLTHLLSGEEPDELRRDRRRDLQGRDCGGVRRDVVRSLAAPSLIPPSPSSTEKELSRSEAVRGTSGHSR